MIDLEKLRFVALLGESKTTKALAKILEDRGIEYKYFDDSSTTNNAEKLKALLNTHQYKELEILAIPTPAVPPYSPLVRTCIDFDICIHSDYDFLYLLDPRAQTIYISGTNGKTTTTQLTSLIIGGLACGNIGVPLSEAYSEIGAKGRLRPLVIETSSFTLFYTSIAVSRVYALLPISDDHISWHGSFENYLEAKLSPIARMDNTSTAIIPLSLRAAVLERLKSTPKKPKLVFFNDLNEEFKIENFQDLAGSFIECRGLKFRGVFLNDALLALNIAKALGFEISSTTIAKLNDFTISPHKMQELHDSDGVLWVNDSKGTNVDATLNALRLYKDQKIFLILGGDDKAADLNPLFEYLSGLSVCVFAIGSNSDKILSLSDKYQITAVKCELLRVAVKAIKASISSIEDKRSIVVLLSPAAASLDQFSSYSERGSEFVRLAGLS